MVGGVAGALAASLVEVVVATVGLYWSLCPGGDLQDGNAVNEQL